MGVYDTDFKVLGMARVNEDQTFLPVVHKCTATCVYLPATEHHCSLAT